MPRYGDVDNLRLYREGGSGTASRGNIHLEGNL